jgi:hypothetical protein
MANGQNPFQKRDVPKAVTDELAARQDPGKARKWNATRFPWIQITSLCSTCPDRLLASTIYQKAPYELAPKTNSILRPNAIVTGVDVKKQGELGTTRRATIKMIAFTDEQLINLQQCFMVPGMGCRVEWGWSVDAQGNATTGAIGNKDTDSDATVTTAIRAQSARSSHYDGLQGIVANFNFSLTKDNTWDISVEVIAAAEAVMGSKVSTHTAGCDCTVKEKKTPDSDEERVVKRSLLYTMFKQLFDDFGKNSAIYKPDLTRIAGIDSKSAYLCTYDYNGTQRTEKGGDDSGFFDSIGSLVGISPTATEPYISWSALEAAINLLCIPTKQNEYALGRLSSTNMELKTIADTTSSDPRVCVIPGTKAHSAVELNEGAESPTASPILLDNIMVNVVFLMTEMDKVEQGDGSLKTFLANVLQRINNVCGGAWDLQVIATTEDNPTGGPVLSVIDGKVYLAGTAFAVPATATSSVVRDIKLEMKMTDSMKTQALYAGGGSKAQQGGKTENGGNCGSNAFKLGGTASYNLAVGKVETPPPCNCGKAEGAGDVATLDELVEELTNEVTDTSANAVRAAIEKSYADLIAKSDDNHCKGMTLPFEFSFTLDGIGGFTFGQMVTCDRIPSAVSSVYDWQVTAVEHSITTQDWTTTVNTVCRYR